MTSPESSIEQQLFLVANEVVYLKAEVVKFLLIENLALKTLLYEKGLITLEEYKQHQERATQLLEASMKERVAKELRQVFDKLKENQEPPAK